MPWILELTIFNGYRQRVENILCRRGKAEVLMLSATGGVGRTVARVGELPGRHMGSKGTYLSKESLQCHSRLLSLP